MMDQIDLLREQQKILSGEVALHSSALKRLSEEAARNPKKEHIHIEIRKLKDEINGKNEQIASLENQIADNILCSRDKMSNGETSQSIAELTEQLNEKSFELEVKTADNRIIQDQLNQKISECEELQQTISSLKQQLSDSLELRNFSPIVDQSQNYLESENTGELCSVKECHLSENCSEKLLLQSQEKEVTELKRKLTELTEAKEQLELRNHKLAEDSSYAKGLASAAAVELKALSEEVSKLMNQNERLAAELAAQKDSPIQRRNSSTLRNGRRDSLGRRQERGSISSDIKRELALSRERELSLSYEAAFAEKEQREAELQKKVEDSKQREAYLENELANMWVLVAKLKKAQGGEYDTSDSTRNSRKIDEFEV